MENLNAVTIEHVSKKFRLYNSVKERLFEIIHPFNKKYHNEFWALKNICLNIPKGKTLGIVGRNGSGKSTLLQIICSVLKSTTGNISVNGKISALLELGAGFNPEFTGRENIIMNGSIQGFSEKEMKKRMSLIEEFADIGEFIDQPVKIYSSGMFIRLAFSAAIHVDPDILIVDEALAVGDVKFQHKCYNKFLEFQKSNKTIIFVSHDTESIIRHCDSAILIENGEIISQGYPKEVTAHYLELLFSGKISGYVMVPELIKQNINDFNIVHYKLKYYALSLSLGSIDLTTISDHELMEYERQGLCVTGASYEEVYNAIANREGCEDLSLLTSKDHLEKEKTQLDKFIDSLDTQDNCFNRKTYNKYEKTEGNKKAEIIDYLIVSNNEYDPHRLNSGATIDIYIKALFHENISEPLMGFSVKSKDGILIYALNSYFIDNVLPPAKESDIVTSKFTLKLNLKAGDYFIDLGVDEKRQSNEIQRRNRDCAYISLHRRNSIVHFNVKEDSWFHGMVNLDAGFASVSKNGSQLENKI